METLALAAAVIMLATIGVSLLALIAGIWRLRVVGWVAGPLSVLAGAWLAVTLPQVWWLAAWCAGAGVWAVFRVVGTR